MTDLWLTLMAVGVLTIATRLSFIVLLQKWQPPALFMRSLRYVPLAVLSALIFPAVITAPATGPLPLDLPRLLGALAASVVAWRSKNIFLTIGAGMVAFYLLRLIV